MAVFCSLCGGDAAEEQKVGCVVSEGNGCPACEERAVIRDKIKRLEEEIIKLKAKYRALGTTANAIHDPFIHKLPPEIGSHIFHLCLPTLNPRQMSSQSGARKALFRVLGLGAVCRKWRQLAWATPRLWQILFIIIHPSTMRSLAGSWPGLINDWLRRSGGLPLTICFVHDQGEFSNPEEFENALEWIIKVLTLHSDRWRNLYLYVDPYTLERLSGSMHLNQLSCLELVVSYQHRRSSAQQIIMKSKPFPTYLRLENFSPTSIDIGWNNITEANLSYLTTNECAEVLRRAPTLERFHVDAFLMPDRPTVHVDSSIIHPRIRSLRLPLEAIKFLDMINLPSLEEWTQDAYGDLLPVMAMVSLLKRSRCSLKILNLRSLSPRRNELVTLFQATPFLQRLQINFLSTKRRNNEVDDIILRIFHSSPDHCSSYESFLPRLQFVECSTLPREAAPVSWDCIPRLYRLGHRRSLTLKSVINPSETSDETAMELLKLVDEGAKFLISDNVKGGDVLENFKKRIGREGR